MITNHLLAVSGGQALGTACQSLFRSTRGRSRELGTDRLSRKDAWAMLKRRLRDAGLSTIYSNHSFRAAGITNYLENDGTLEVAQRIAGHADSRTTKLYDRRGQRCSSKTWNGFATEFVLAHRFESR